MNPEHLRPPYIGPVCVSVRDNSEFVCARMCDDTHGDDWKTDRHRDRSCPEKCPPCTARDLNRRVCRLGVHRRAVSRIRSPATLIIRRRYITIMTHFYGPNRCRIVRAPRPTRPLPSSLALRPSDPNAGAFASTQLPPRRLLTGALSLSAYAGGVDSPLAPRPRV